MQAQAVELRPLLALLQTVHLLARWELLGELLPLWEELVLVMVLAEPEQTEEVKRLLAVTLAVTETSLLIFRLRSRQRLARAAVLAAPVAVLPVQVVFWEAELAARIILTQTKMDETEKTQMRILALAVVAVPRLHTMMVTAETGRSGLEMAATEQPAL